MLEIDGIPESGKVLEGKLTIKGGEDFAITFNWTGNEATDPSNHITTS